MQKCELFLLWHLCGIFQLCGARASVALYCGITCIINYLNKITMSEKFDAEKVDLTDSKYAREYDENKLWDKVKSVAKKAGIKVIYYVLVLYYALQSENVTMAEKALIVAALGYFILPLDLIPDFIPIAGYGDDAAVLYGLIKKLDCIDERVKAQAKSKLKEWFGNYDESKLED